MRIRFALRRTWGACFAAHTVPTDGTESAYRGIEGISMLSSLPNLHPAVVHFPVVLIPLALVLEALALGVKSAPWRRSAAVMWMAAALSASLAVLAGQVAADSLVDVPAGAQVAIGRHSDWAYTVAWSSWAVAASRGLAELGPERWWGVSLRIVGGVAGLAVLGLVAWTADLGGALVYQHGLGVRVAESPLTHGAARAERSPAPTLPDHRRPLLVDVAGTWIWEPVPADALRLQGKPWPASGAVFDIDGASSVRFEPEFGDLQLNVWLDVSDFDGEIRLLHHVNGTQASAFEVRVGEQAGMVRLVNRGQVLDSAPRSVSGRHALAVNATGTHFKGIVDGESVVHGHASAVAGGRAGIELDGFGRVVIERVEIVPLNQNVP